jgi:protein SCO1
VGNPVRFDGFVDENGHEFSAPLRALDRDALPWIVSPMYTKCPGTCSTITASLHRALQQSGLTSGEYRVLSFSFDPNEADDGLRAFRTRLQLPSDWLTLRARDPQILERTLRSLDFRTITMADGGFEHPNLVAVLAPDMRLTGYLFGINLAPTELARAVRRARRGVSAVDAWWPYRFLVASLGFITSGCVFAWLLSRRRQRMKRTPLLAATPTGTPPRT